MLKERITVITVCFNAEATIEKTLQSVLEQTYTPLEYIIVDGKSTDHTCGIVEKYKSRFLAKGCLFKFISEKDSGIYCAMNKGIKMATGKWINFMNAGDRFYGPEVIEQVFSRDIASDIKAVYGNAIMRKQWGNRCFFAENGSAVLQKMVACHQAIFVDAQDLKEHPFDLKYRISADYHYMYQLYQRKGRFLPLPLTIAEYEAESGLSSVHKLELRREYAQIKGIDQTWQWQITFLRKAFEVYAQRFLKELCPITLFIFLQRWNHKRLEKRHSKKLALECA